MAEQNKSRDGSESYREGSSQEGEPDMADAKIHWSWTVGPQTIIGVANFIVLFLGVVGLWFKMQADVEKAKDTVTELKAAVVTLINSQTTMVERMTKVETKVDIMLPLVQRTNEQTFGRVPSNNAPQTPR